MLEYGAFLAGDMLVMCTDSLYSIDQGNPVKNSNKIISVPIPFDLHCTCMYNVSEILESYIMVFG